MTADTPRTDDQFRNATKMVSDHIVDANKMVSDTPRTDGFRDADSLLESWEQEWELAISFAKGLERELASTTEEYCKVAFDLTEQTQRAQKAEAEVDRLRGLLQEARPVLRHTAMYCFDAVNCICGTEYLEERIDDALNPDNK